MSLRLLKFALQMSRASVPAKVHHCISILDYCKKGRQNVGGETGRSEIFENWKFDLRRFFQRGSLIRIREESGDKSRGWVGAFKES